MMQPLKLKVDNRTVTKVVLKPIIFKMCLRDFRDRTVTKVVLKHAKETVYSNADFIEQ